MLINVDDTIINLAQIQTIERLPPPVNGPSRSRCHVTFADGRKLVVCTSLEHLEQYTGAIVPAPAGYTVVRVYDHDDQPVFYETKPVVAFSYRGESGGPLAALTDEGFLPDDCNYVLIRPDGTGTNFDRGYDNLDAFKAEAEAYALERRSKKVAA